MGSRAARLAVITAASILLGLGQAELARASAGDVRREIPAGAPGGVSVAFDGENLYYTDRNGIVLHSVTTAGTARPDVPIVGASGLNALSYDVTLDQFWAVDSTGLGVYRLSRDGTAAKQFTLVPAFDLPGVCGVATGCSAIVAGLAYDNTNSTLWYAPQLSERIYHFTTAGQLMGYFDTKGTSSLFPDCATNGVTGIASGGSSLFLAAGDCRRGFQYTKSDTTSASKLGTFAVAGPRAGDVECDNLTFAATVLWVRDTADGRLRAVEVPSGSCVFGGGVALFGTAGWMSGAGIAISQYATDVHHAFHVLCADPGPNGAGPPNNMVLNWSDVLGNQFSFHLSKVTSVSCFFNIPPGAQPPPCTLPEEQCFNKMIGTGKGWLRGRGPTGLIVAGAQVCDACGDITFEFTDHGEPNVQDDGSLNIFDPNLLETTGTDVVLFSCACKKANYQAHRQR
jgi:hypothetical protein